MIKGLGEFSGTEGSVLYRPDRELADAVNAPFAAFSAVELPDGMDLIEDDQPSGPTVRASSSMVTILFITHRGLIFQSDHAVSCPDGMSALFPAATAYAVPTPCR